jgi:hypothetical protein
MAVEGIASFLQNRTDQLFGEKQERQTETNILGTGRPRDTAAREDTFTPSTQNRSAQASAQDAGIFQVSQIALTAATANILFEQATPNGNQNGAPAQGATGTATNAGGAPSASATNSRPPANTAQAPTGAPAASTNEQDQIQALNAALPALGLSNEEIHQIDRIASLIRDFNPAAFTDLVNQFEALAQQAAQQSAANASNTAGPNTAGGTSASGGGSQVQEILITFTGLQETVSTGGINGGSQGAGSKVIQITEASLQIEKVQFTLTNAYGQTVQVHAPQKDTSAGTTDRRTSQTHVAAA